MGVARSLYQPGCVRAHKYENAGLPFYFGSILTVFCVLLPLLT